jgi:phage gpG-like protein
MRLSLDRSELRRAAQQSTKEEIRTGGRQVLNRAKILTPVDTGRLRASLKMTESGDTVTISTNVAYAEYVHDGTRPHVIRPNRRQALRFVVGGRVVYAKVVHHPGTRARPFLTRALMEVSRQRGWNYSGGNTV